MGQDVNKIIDNIGNEWAGDAVILRKRIAILLEENERLREKIKQLEKNKQSK